VRGSSPPGGEGKGEGEIRRRIGNGGNGVVFQAFLCIHLKFCYPWASSRNYKSEKNGSTGWQVLDNSCFDRRYWRMGVDVVCLLFH